MKINKPPRSKVPFIIAGVFIALAIAGGGFAWSQFSKQDAKPDNTKPINTVDYGPATEDQKQEGQDIKKESIDRNAQDETPEPSTPKTLGLTLNHLRQVEQAVLIRSIVTGTTSGTCEATFSRSGQTNVTKTIPISVEATTATCNADLTANDFPAGGEWKLSLVAKTGSASSETVTQNITIEK